MPYKIPVSVLVVIHTPDNHILLLDRARQPGYWQSVTGSQESGENLRQTAVREVAEETGLHIAASDLRDWHITNHFRITLTPERFAPGTTHNEEHVFSLCVPSGTTITLSPSEHSHYRWLPAAAAAEACFSWSNRDAIWQLAQPTN